MQRTPMTAQGAQALQAELEQLKNIERKKITEAIARARELGDLKENAEYHAAREQQSFCEGRIRAIEDKLAHAQIIDVTKVDHQGRVVFGACVTVLKEGEETQVTYRIVGDEEADLKSNQISVNSPIARALIGKEIGQEVTVSTPAGAVDYEIVEIEYR